MTTDTRSTNKILIPNMSPTDMVIETSIRRQQDNYNKMNNNINNETDPTVVSTIHHNNNNSNTTTTTTTTEDDIVKDLFQAIKCLEGMEYQQKKMQLTMKELADENDDLIKEIFYLTNELKESKKHNKSLVKELKHVKKYNHTLIQEREYLTERLTKFEQQQEQQDSTTTISSDENNEVCTNVESSIVSYDVMEKEFVREEKHLQGKEEHMEPTFAQSTTESNNVQGDIDDEAEDDNHHSMALQMDKWQTRAKIARSHVFHRFKESNAVWDISRNIHNISNPRSNCIHQLSYNKVNDLRKQQNQQQNLNRETDNNLYHHATRRRSSSDGTDGNTTANVSCVAEQSLILEEEEYQNKTQSQTSCSTGEVNTENKRQTLIRTYSSSRHATSSSSSTGDTAQTEAGEDSSEIKASDTKSYSGSSSHNGYTSDNIISHIEHASSSAGILVSGSKISPFMEQHESSSTSKPSIPSIKEKEELIVGGGKGTTSNNTGTSIHDFIHKVDEIVKRTEDGHKKRSIRCLKRVGGSTSRGYESTSVLGGVSSHTTTSGLFSDSVNSSSRFSIQQHSIQLSALTEKYQKKYNNPNFNKQQQRHNQGNDDNNNNIVLKKGPGSSIINNVHSGVTPVTAQNYSTTTGRLKPAVRVTKSSCAA